MHSYRIISSALKGVSTVLGVPGQTEFWMYTQEIANYYNIEAIVLKNKVGNLGPMQLFRVIYWLSFSWGKYLFIFLKRWREWQKKTAAMRAVSQM